MTFPFLKWVFRLGKFFCCYYSLVLMQNVAAGVYKGWFYLEEWWNFDPVIQPCGRFAFLIREVFGIQSSQTIDGANSSDTAGTQPNPESRIMNILQMTACCIFYLKYKLRTLLCICCFNHLIYTSFHHTQSRFNYFLSMPFSAWPSSKDWLIQLTNWEENI